MVAAFLRAAGIALWVQFLIFLRILATQNFGRTVVRKGPTAMTYFSSAYCNTVC